VIKFPICTGGVDINYIGALMSFRQSYEELDQ
jgi:hypothetical protein